MLLYACTTVSQAFGLFFFFLPFSFGTKVFVYLIRKLERQSRPQSLLLSISNHLFMFCKAKTKKIKKGKNIHFNHNRK